jgi:hypothetical protein
MSLLDALPGPDEARFDGSDYEPEHDDARLSGQLRAVYEATRDHRWRTVKEIQAATGIRLDATVAKMLRNLRLERFGAFAVEKRRRGAAEGGVWEYRVGAKGSAGVRSRTTSPERAALDAADALVPYLRHDPNCNLEGAGRALLAAEGCNCGLDEARRAWTDARQATRG